MAKTPPRFPRRIDTWVADEIGDALDRVSQAQDLPISVLMRQAARYYLGAIGALPAPPRPNGQHPAESSHAR